MGGGRTSWAVRAVAGLIVAQLAASGAVLAVRPGNARPAALLRAAPPATAPPTTVAETPTAAAAPDAPSPTAPPTTSRAPVSPPPPTDAAGRLTSRLEAALGSVRSCLVVWDGSTPVYSREAEAPLTPASTQKLLVAAAALDQLGPDFRFMTRVVAPAPPKDGAVDALWLVGAGDPLLATPEYGAYLNSRPRTRGTPLTPLANLADVLVAAGIQKVPGGVHGDDSRYEALRWLPGWRPLYRDEADVSPLSALTVNGGLDRWSPSEKVTDDPTALTSYHLARLLVARGVSTVPAPNQTRPAAGVVLAALPSAPLSQIVAAMLRSSDNLAAELLVRELDRHAGGTGTTVGGLRVVASTAQKLGLPTTGLHQTDGSGLDPANRVSCSQLLGALHAGDRPGMDAIVAGLPVAARSGTLVNRYGGTPLAGSLAAKTGWIDCAAGMVGRLGLHRPLSFALLVNGPCNYDAAEAVVNRVALALASYPG